MIDQGNSIPPDVFWSSLYQTVVSFTGLILPMLVIPPALILAMIRSCLTAHCCQPKYKQAAGEIFLVFLVTLVYIGSIAGSIIPHLDKRMDEFSVDLDFGSCFVGACQCCCQTCYLLSLQSGCL